jgi:methyl-accepting chemotaxis protein
MFSRSINAAVRITAFVVFILVVMVGAAGMWLAEKSETAVRDLERSAALVQRHMQADMMHDAVRADIASALAARDPSTGISGKDARNDLKEHIAEFRAQVEEARKLATSPATKAALEKVAAPLEDYARAADQMRILIDRDANAAGAYFPKFSESFNVLATAMGTASEEIEAYSAGIRAKSEAEISFNQTLLVIALSSALFILWMVTLVAHRKLVKPLVSLANATERVGEGAFDVAIPATVRKDEIGRLARAVEGFRDASIKKAELEASAAAGREEQARVVSRLGEAMAELADSDFSNRIDTAFPEDYDQLRQDFNGALDSLSKALRSVSEAAGSIRSGATEISEASEDLALRTERQAATLEQTSATCKSVSHSVQETAAGALGASQMIEDAHADAMRGGEVVREAVAAMGDIERSSRAIEQIISVIDSIAFQTNLLALNAGVEAARAGEAGKGFAVVANEVRALAQRTADSAHEVKELIGKSAEQVKSGVRLVSDTGEALDRIVSKIGEVSHVVQEASTAAERQADNLQEVTKAVSDIDMATQQNAAMVEQAAAATRSLLEQSDQLADLVAKFTLPARTMGANPSRRDLARAA